MARVNQPAPVARPATTQAPTTGNSIKLELPLAQVAKPAVSDRVLVRTPLRIGGQFEHAAIVTRVHTGSETRINVLLMPDGEAPYPVPDIDYSAAPSITVIGWRWPPPCS